MRITFKVGIKEWAELVVVSTGDKLVVDTRDKVRIAGSFMAKI